MLFQAIGREPDYVRLPVWIFDVTINFLQWLADIFKNEQLENAAELGRIGKYYAVEDMVEVDNRYGTITLQEYFNRIASDGQEFDPYTSMTGILGMLGNGEETRKEVPRSDVQFSGYSLTNLAPSRNDTSAAIGPIGGIAELV
jgi:hypothetical protein